MISTVFSEFYIGVLRWTYLINSTIGKTGVWNG